MIHRLEIATKSKTEFQEITSQVRDIVVKSGVGNGVCHIFVPHTTAAVMVNEHADPSVVEDIAAQLETLVPQHNNYRHTEGNAAAHIKTSLLGSPPTLLVESGQLVLGTWQGIFFCEFDGPRQRIIMVKVQAER